MKSENRPRHLFDSLPNRAGDSRFFATRCRGVGGQIASQLACHIGLQERAHSDRLEYVISTLSRQTPFEVVERSFERDGLVFGFFPGSSRGSGQYQPQLHPISVAGVSLSTPARKLISSVESGCRRRFRWCAANSPTCCSMLAWAGIIETAEADELFPDRPDRGVRIVLFDLEAPRGCRFSGRFGKAQRQRAVFESGLRLIEIDPCGQRDRALKVSKRPLDPIASLFFTR
jgi:hypothetical protein